MKPRWTKRLGLGWLLALVMLACGGMEVRVRAPAATATPASSRAKVPQDEGWTVMANAHQLFYGSDACGPQSVTLRVTAIQGEPTDAAWLAYRWVDAQGRATVPQVVPLTYQGPTWVATLEVDAAVAQFLAGEPGLLEYQVLPAQGATPVPAAPWRAAHPGRLRVLPCPAGSRAADLGLRGTHDDAGLSVRIVAMGATPATVAHGPQCPPDASPVVTYHLQVEPAQAVRKAEVRFAIAPQGAGVPLLQQTVPLEAAAPGVFRGQDDLAQRAWPEGGYGTLYYRFVLVTTTGLTVLSPLRTVALQPCPASPAMQAPRWAPSAGPHPVTGSPAVLFAIPL